MTGNTDTDWANDGGATGGVGMDAGTAVEDEAVGGGGTYAGMVNCAGLCSE